MAKKKIEIVIQRSKWRTGGSGDYKTGHGNTQLLNSSGYKCCLGFVANYSRPSNCKIRNIYSPHGCSFFIPELNNVHEDGCSDTQLTEDAIGINDDESTTQKQKEIQLKKLFKNSIYKLKFVD